MVSGARVWAIPRDQLEDLAALAGGDQPRPLEWDLGVNEDLTLQALELLPHSGDGLRTDPRGRVQLPCSDRDAPHCVVARTPGHAGVLTEARPVDGPFVLQVLADRSLHAQLIDHQGRPCPGVPVQLVLESAGGRLESLGRATTDQGGDLRFHHLDAVVPRHQRSALCLVPVLPIAPAVVHPLSLEADRPPWVQIRLPPTSRIEIDLLDTRGHRYLPENARPLRLHLELRGHGGGVLSKLTGYLEAGPLTLPYVGLGQLLALDARSDPRGFLIDGVRIQAPEKAGATLRSRLEIDAHVPVVVCRVLGPDGRALRDAEVELGIWYFGSLRHTQGPRVTSKTDAEGRARFELFAWSGMYLEAGEAWLSTGTKEQALAAFLDLGKKPWRGVRDFGDQRLSPGQGRGEELEEEEEEEEAEPPRAAQGYVAASGRAVDEAGNPVAGAVVRATVGGSHGTRHRTTTDAEGRFEIHVDQPVWQVQLDPIYTPTMRSGRCGCTGGGLTRHTAVLYRQWRLEWNIDLPPSFDASLLSIAVTGRKPDGERDELWLRVPQDGFVTATANCLDDAHLQLRLRGDGLLFERRGLQTRAATDGTIRVLRMPRLDLRGELRRVSITVVDPQGHGVPRVAAGMLNGRASSTGEDWETQSGRLRFWTRQAEFSLLVRAPGWRTQVFEGLRGDERIQLSPPIQVQLRARPTGLSIPAPYRLAARIKLEQAADPRHKAGYVPDDKRRLIRFGASGLATLQVGSPGRYLLEYYVCRHGPNDRLYPAYDKTRFYVRPGSPAGQRFELAPDAAKIKSALEVLPFYLAPR